MANKYEHDFPKIGAPALRALDSIGIKKLADLTSYTQEDLLALHT